MAIDYQKESQKIRDFLNDAKVLSSELRTNHDVPNHILRQEASEIIDKLVLIIDQTLTMLDNI